MADSTKPCVIKGPYHPVGDVDFECQTHKVVAVLRDPSRYGAGDLRLDEMRCPVGEPTGWETVWPYFGRSDECPNRERHRGPEGPNEDIAQCGSCGTVSYSMRPSDETFGWHDDDCSLPVGHESFCKPGGAGHPPALTIRGFWPHDPRSEDFRG